MLGYLPHLRNLCGPVLRPPWRYSSVSISAFRPLHSENVPVSTVLAAPTASPSAAEPMLAAVASRGLASSRNTEKSKTGTGFIRGIGNPRALLHHVHNALAP